MNTVMNDTKDGDVMVDISLRRPPLPPYKKKNDKEKDSDLGRPPVPLFKSNSGVIVEHTISEDDGVKIDNNLRRPPLPPYKKKKDQEKESDLGRPPVPQFNSNSEDDGVKIDNNLRRPPLPPYKNRTDHEQNNDLGQPPVPLFQSNSGVIVEHTISVDDDLKIDNMLRRPPLPPYKNKKDQEKNSDLGRPPVPLFKSNSAETVEHPINPVIDLVEPEINPQSEDLLLSTLKEAVTKAQSNYHEWYTGQKDDLRGPSGFFSWFRHGSYGQKRAETLKNNVLKSDDVTAIYTIINTFLDDKNTRYHNHSFASFLMDELNGTAGFKANIHTQAAYRPRP